MKRAHFGLITVGTMALVTLVTLTSVIERAYAADDKAAAIRKDRQQIAGTWRIISLEVKGNKADDEGVRKMTVVNGADGTWSLRSEGKEIGRGTTTIDPTQKPKTIDIKSSTGEDQEQTVQGIYELGKKTRKLCYASVERPRPTEFTSTAENEHILVIFERVEPDPKRPAD